MKIPLINRCDFFLKIRGCVFIAAFFLFFFFFGCSTTGSVKHADSVAYFTLCCHKLQKGDMDLEDFVKASPENGFFYVLDENAVVLAHPSSHLKGVSFRRYVFIDYIMRKGNGCLSFSTAKGDQFLVFMRLPAGLICCYSVGESFLKDRPESCEKLQQVRGDEAGS